MASFSIAERQIGDESTPYLIAEIGHNHGGRLRTAERLLRAAAEAGADAVKLQKRHNPTLFTRAMYGEPYSGRNSYGATYGEHREALEFELDDYRRLGTLAAELGIALFATAFDLPSLDFLAELGVPAIKIASSDLAYTRLLKQAAATGIPLVVSTGGAELADVERAHTAIRETSATVPLALLQCTAAYPAAPEDLNLSVITAYRERFPDAVIGFSGHDLGTKLSVTAQRLGARIVEKHFTLDRGARGSDHHFSLLPDELSGLAEAFRFQSVKVETAEDIAESETDPEVLAALGSPVKRYSTREAAALRKLAKSVVAARPVRAGHRLTADDLTCKSPGDGPVRPYREEELVGTVVTADLEPDEPLRPEVLAQPAPTSR